MTEMKPQNPLWQCE